MEEPFDFINSTFKRITQGNVKAIITTNLGEIVKTNLEDENQAKEYGKLAIGLLKTISGSLSAEPTRLIRINTSKSELSIAVVPDTGFLLITVNPIHIE